MAARDDMAAYMRERRARLKAEAEKAVALSNARKPKGVEAQRARRRAERASAPGVSREPVIDAPIPRDALLKASASELATVRAKATAIGPGAVTPAAFEARQQAAAPTPSRPPVPASYRPPAPPASMFAIGGTAGRGLIPQGRGMPAPPDIAATSTYGLFMSRTETMLAALAARSDQQERRIAALEAAEAERRNDMASFFTGLFRAFASIPGGRR